MFSNSTNTLKTAMVLYIPSNDGKRVIIHLEKHFLLYLYGFYKYVKDCYRISYYSCRQFTSQKFVVKTITSHFQNGFSFQTSCD